ncbi:MAG: DUF502 domain-containing protein [Puniceicoccales bacterium]|jgi:uncharacterized membrane protein|nr:DUF502 domain-containing protein [Puniceicoccales bacterium]
MFFLAFSPRLIFLDPMIRSLRNAFFTGLLILLPLGITVFLVTLLIEAIGAPASKLFFHKFYSTFPAYGLRMFAINCIATLLVVALITSIGYISRYFLGRFIIRGTEKLITKLPFVRMLYGTTKQIVDTFSEGKRAVFQRAVMVEFPRKGIYSIGFQTGEAEGELSSVDRQEMISVFIPTTPNPTSGFLVFVREDQCKLLKMSIGDAMKAIISGGALVPHREPECPKTSSAAAKKRSPRAAAKRSSSVT